MRPGGSWRQETRLDDLREREIEITGAPAEALEHSLVAAGISNRPPTLALALALTLGLCPRPDLGAHTLMLSGGCGDKQPRR